MFSRLNLYLNKPVPYECNYKKDFCLIFCVGIFVFLFLYLFEPFGISKSNINNKTIILFGFGLVTMAMLFVLTIIIPKVLPGLFNSNNWKVKNEIVLHIIIILFIAAGNLAYSYFILDSGFSISAFFIYLFNTLLLGLIPVTSMALIKSNISLRKNLKTAEEINRFLLSDGHTLKICDNDEKEVFLTSENEKETLKIKLSDLLFIKSAGNYVEINWINNQKPEKSLLRSPLKRVEDQLKKYPSIFRCHRTYLINLRKIEKMNGNSRDCKLKCINLDYKIPVSRSSSKKLRKLIFSKSG